MSTFFFELPTTGAISFGDFTRDTAGTHASDLIQATSSRAAVRTALKETKRMGAEKDYLRVIKVHLDYHSMASVLTFARSSRITFLTCILSCHV